jgi:hypothetical protein
VSLQPLPGAPGLLAVELACEGGRVALVRDPAQPHAMLALHGEGRTVALRLDDTAQRVLSLALRESVASALTVKPVGPGLEHGAPLV